MLSDDLVLTRCERDGVPCCEVCGDPLKGERGMDWAIHHRQFRDGGPEQESPANKIAVCGGSNVDRCHGVIHSGKAYAMTQGWAISRHATKHPATFPVLIGMERWTYLLDDGGYSNFPPKGER